jgi:hypothetical protein
VPLLPLLLLVVVALVAVAGPGPPALVLLATASPLAKMGSPLRHVPSGAWDANTTCGAR